MPKSDTWPGGTGLETMISMDSAGSCDSVVSANSGFSDDSLEHLSAEEKACLMFLEETIESLDTEEDSGLSNDEPDQLPNPGNLATKLANLSASMSKTKLSSSQKNASKEAMKENVDTKPTQTYLVPTPLVVASSSLCSVSSARPGVPPDKNLCSQSHFTPSSKGPGRKHNQNPVATQEPLEVNVVILPPTKTRDYSVRTAEGPLPRGPLSYDALVHLRRSASTKKTPLCPTIDHTIDSDKHLPVRMDGLKPRSDKSHSDVSTSKTSPPVVPPKPKKIPVNISVKTQNEASTTSDSSNRITHATDPKVVRLEALQKLGLLKDQESENETLAPLPPPKSNSSLNTTPNKFTRGPSNANPSRSPSFCYSQVPSEPKNRPLQSSASFHHVSRNAQPPVSVTHPQSNGLKASGPHNNPNSVKYTAMVVPGMGTDRKEALRKLGLLKD
uniref:specifically androgen-regulated gene protein isoform X2 n=1 Tax=Scatophagus argus TaxID=75038 RepID=UPI001ED7F582|nr:specifically androgen-regulated gene protein isoform X2 [Scatophagus argus]